MPASYVEAEVCYRSPWGQGCLLGAGTVTKSVGWDGQRWRCDHYSAVLCLGGSAQYGNDAGTWPVGPGMLFQRHPGHVHSLNITGEGWRECWIALGQDLWQPLLASRILSPDQGVITVDNPDRWAAAVAAACRDLDQVEDRYLAAFIPRLMALVIEVLMPPPETHQGSAVQRACAAMGRDPRFNLHAFAAAEGIPFDRFRKLFRTQVGVSPGRYLILRRIDRARTLLFDQSLSVATVAAMLGYPDAFTFSTQFRTVAGCSPKDWRRGRSSASDG